MLLRILKRKATSTNLKLYKNKHPK